MLSPLSTHTADHNSIKNGKRKEGKNSPVRRERQAQILYSLGVPMLTEKWIGDNLKNNKRSAEILPGRRGSMTSMGGDTASSVSKNQQYLKESRLNHFNILTPGATSPTFGGSKETADK